ncbi:MAG: DUF1833 family protein [Gammaproteobacteria bacterium]|nr:DUF1833 family protein [Gammaproteobacteria bacterium]
MAQDSNEVWVTLLKISHASLGAPLYFCNNTEDVTHSGQIYTAFPFQITLPSDESEREPVASLTISNVDRRLVDEIRSISSGPSMEVRVVLASSPSTTEYGPVALKATSVSYDANAITFQLGFEAYGAEPLPATKFTPEWFPGMFV